MNAFRVDGKLAMVTGASSGIGQAIAIGLARAGAEVVLVARREGALGETAQQVEAIGRKASVCPTDLADVQSIPDWYRQVVAEHGRPDILVNAAATTKRAPADQLALEDWEAIITLNLTAVFALCQAFAQACIADGAPGRIINVASLMTAASRPGTSAYTASKGGIGQLTKALAIDWASNGILVNAIAPGYIATPLTKPLLDDPEFDAWVKKRCPIGRWGKPEDIALPAVFLASSAADFMTGQVIYVDGGWLATF
jgi:NAD(P)-dependent dehydrogenase (short-subunit alcohol dehydrogenase family)